MVDVLVIGVVLAVMVGAGWVLSLTDGWDKDYERVPYPERPVEPLDWRQG